MITPLERKRYWPEGGTAGDAFRECRKCHLLSDRDLCPKCGNKVTIDPVDPRRERDLVDLFTKTRTDFQGVSLLSALEILSNGDCAD